MPISRFLGGNNPAFAPDDIKNLVTAFEDVLATLRPTGRNDPTKELAAKRIIELASQGNRDPIFLRDTVLKSFRDDPRSSGLAASDNKETSVPTG